MGAYFVYKYMNFNKETDAKNVLIIKKYFLIKLINRTSQRNKRQNGTYYFFNDMINIKTLIQTY